ncbi:MAG: hypothetical protein ABGZ17_25085 [Planctomycetaceae bacterium]
MIPDQNGPPPACASAGHQPDVCAAGLGIACAEVKAVGRGLGNQVVQNLEEQHRAGRGMGQILVVVPFDRLAAAPRVGARDQVFDEQETTSLSF